MTGQLNQGVQAAENQPLGTQSLGNKEQEILEKYDRESVTRRLKSGWGKQLIGVIAVFYSLFHLYITFYPMPTLLQRAIHVAVGCALIFLIYPSGKRSRRDQIAWYEWLWVAAALAGAGYLIYQYQAIMTVRGGIPNTADIVMAVITVLVVLEAARRITGWVLVIFALLQTGRQASLTA